MAFVRSALDLCPELLVRPGILTSRAPTAGEDTDIAFGWELANEMGRLDVGQSVAVKERAVLAVEAIEGPTAPFSEPASCAGRRLHGRQGRQAAAGHAL